MKISIPRDAITKIEMLLFAVKQGGVRGGQASNGHTKW